MNITDVRVRIIKDKGRLKAAATITIDDCFVVKDLRIVEGSDSLFIGMPSRKTKSGEFTDIAHPINKEVRTIIEEKVLAAYKEELAKAETEETA